jgi:hypothetical protein
MKAAASLVAPDFVSEEVGTSEQAGGAGVEEAAQQASGGLLANGGSFQG